MVLNHTAGGLWPPSSKPGGRAGLVARAADHRCAVVPAALGAVRPRCPAAVRFTWRLAICRRSTISLGGAAGQAATGSWTVRKSLADFNFRRPLGRQTRCNRRRLRDIEWIAFFRPSHPPSPANRCPATRFPNSIGDSLAAWPRGPCWRRRRPVARASAAASDVPDKVWGKLGIGNGQFSKPRAIAIDKDDHLYIVDMTARIQVFDVDGNFIRAWQTPAHRQRPADRADDQQRGRQPARGRHALLPRADLHAGGRAARTTARSAARWGRGRASLGLSPTRSAMRDGNYFVGEYGEYDRIQKFTPEGKYILEWGGHGSEPGQFLRPQHLEFDADGLLWVTDSCNHRIQVFDGQGKLVKMWGTPGTEPGQLQYPYCLILDGKGHVYVCEYGNNRVQKFTLDGKSVASLGHVRPQAGPIEQPVGDGARQPRAVPRAGFDESPRAAVCAVRCR